MKLGQGEGSITDWRAIKKIARSRCFLAKYLTLDPVSQRTDRSHSRRVVQRGRRPPATYLFRLALFSFLFLRVTD